MMTIDENHLRKITSASLEEDVMHAPRELDLVDHFCLDSLACLQLLAGLEQRFDVMFSNDQIESLRTLEGIKEAIENCRRVECCELG